MNGSFIRQLTLDELYDRLTKFWPPEAEKYDDNYKQKVLAIVQERLKYFAELPDLTKFFFADLPVNPELISGNKQLKKVETSDLKLWLEQARDVLQASSFEVEDLQNSLNHLLETSGQKPGVLFSLIRIATTQAPASPGLAETLAVLGKETSLRRIDQQLANF